jgi:hypothetical protein
VCSVWACYFHEKLEERPTTLSVYSAIGYHVAEVCDYDVDWPQRNHFLVAVYPVGNFTRAVFGESATCSDAAQKP